MFQPDDKCFLCPCAACRADPDSEGIEQELADRLNLMQHHIVAQYSVSGTMLPTSGRRCAAHNLAVGGKPSSKHLLGKAVDIGTGGSAEVAYRIVDAAMVESISFIELCPNHVHLDIRELDEPQLIIGVRG